jgi:metal transporter CNNM
MLFTEQVIPQAVCSKHGLAIGANLIWLVKILMVLCWPISYPVGKVNNPLLFSCVIGFFFFFFSKFNLI